MAVRKALFLGAALAAVIFGGAAKAAQPTISCAPGTGPIGSTQGCVLLPQVSSAAESSHVFDKTAATVADFQINNTNALARWVLLYDGTSAPANGTLTACVTSATPRPCITKFYQVPANQTIGVTWSPGPFLQHQTGVVMLCSSTGPLNFTAANDCLFSYEGM